MEVTKAHIVAKRLLNKHGERICRIRDAIEYELRAWIPTEQQATKEVRVPLEDEESSALTVDIVSTIARAYEGEGWEQVAYGYEAADRDSAGFHIFTLQLPQYVDKAAG